MKIKTLFDQEQRVIDALGEGDLEIARDEFLKWQELRGDFLQYLFAEVLTSEKSGKKMTKKQYREATKNRESLDTGNAYNLDQIPTDAEIRNRNK